MSAVLSPVELVGELAAAAFESVAIEDESDVTAGSDDN